MAFFFMALVKNDEQALNICKYLIKEGVNPAHKDKHSQTCLYYTVREGIYETSKYLIENCTKLYGEFWGIFATNVTNNLNTFKLYNLAATSDEMAADLKLWQAS